jgi:hypothetical protein
VNNKNKIQVEIDIYTKVIHATWFQIGNPCYVTYWWPECAGRIWAVSTRKSLVLWASLVTSHHHIVGSCNRNRTEHSEQVLMLKLSDYQFKVKSFQQLLETLNVKWRKEKKRKQSTCEWSSCTLWYTRRINSTRLKNWDSTLPYISDSAIVFSWAHLDISGDILITNRPIKQIKLTYFNKFIEQTKLNYFPCYMIHANFLPGLIFDPEDAGQVFLRNVGSLSIASFTD